MYKKKTPQYTPYFNLNQKLLKFKASLPLHPALTKAKDHSNLPIENNNKSNKTPTPLNQEYPISQLKSINSPSPLINENNENILSNNFIPLDTPKEEKTPKAIISLTSDVNAIGLFPEQKHSEIIKVPNANNQTEPNNITRQNKSNQNENTNTNTQLYNNNSLNKSTQNLLLQKTPSEQIDEFYNYDEEKPIELTKEEKEIFGNREMKNYSRIKILGKGGCGIVWLCQLKANSNIISQCAVKQISKKNLSAYSPYISPSNTQIAKREIEILKILNSDEENKCAYIVDFYDSYEDQNDIWFAFEKCGKSLSSLSFKVKGDFLKNERIYTIKKGLFIKWLFADISQFKYLIRTLLQSLDFINSHGIIHADIKPENILIDYNAPIDGNKFKITKVKVIDYGSAFYANDPCAISSNTPEYLCPELTEIMEGRSRNTKRFFEDLKRYTSCVDVWSLGVTVLEMVLCCPVWMSYKAKVTIRGKSSMKTGIFGFKGRDGFKIYNKQRELVKNLHKVMNQSMIYMFCDKDKESFEDLMRKMLNPKYKERITPKEALKHEFLKEE